VYELAKKLSKFWRINILTTGDAFRTARIGSRIDVTSLRPILNPMNNPIVPTLVFRIIKSMPSLIHVHGVYQSTLAFGYLAARLTGTPILASMHGRPFYKSKLKLCIQRIYEKTILKFIIRRLDKVIATTPSDYQLLLKMGVKKGNVALIPNATDTSFWKPQDDNKPHLRNDKDRFILFVGSLIERKSCEDALKAFHKIRNNYVGQLIIVGRGPCEKSLIHQSESYDLTERVFFEKGVPRSRLLELYAKADVLVHPSKMEGLPTVILEAMSAGAIVVSSDIDAVKNLIKDNSNGFLFSVGKAKDLAEVVKKILSLSSDDRMRISAEARKTIVDYYGWNTTTKQIVELYLKMNKI
jgi:glycosyltransferase involved in cell wall biosynthesis